MRGETAFALSIFARVGALELDVKLPRMPGTTVVIGPSGAGKTTLLLLVLGALPMTYGSVCVGDSTLFDSDRRINIPLQQRRFAFVPQDYALFPHLTVIGNVEFAIRSSAPDLSRHRAKEQAQLALDGLGILGLGRRNIAELSGGEKQRVALARALATQPRALLLDEPLAALDVHSRRETRHFLRSYLGSLGLPCLIVSHDPEDARALAHQVVAIEAGRVTQLGTQDELGSRPATGFVRDFFANTEDELVSRLRRERLRL